jgi:hypothetical protein
VLLLLHLQLCQRPCPWLLLLQGLLEQMLQAWRQREQPLGTPWGSA